MLAIFFYFIQYFPVMGRLVYIFLSTSSLNRFKNHRQSTMMCWYSILISTIKKEIKLKEYIMKKLTLILAFVTGSMVSFSQNNNSIIPPDPIEQSKFSVGVIGGFGHSFLVPYSNPAFMPSWNVGLSAIFSPFEHAAFGIDALYSAEGVKFNNAEYSSVTQLNYVRIPVKAIYFFRDYKHDFRPKFAIGPTIGFLANASDNPGFNNIDLGANASLGFNYRLLRAVWLNMDASYYQGFTDVYNGNTETDLNGNARLNVGLSFGF